MYHYFSTEQNCTKSWRITSVQFRHIIVQHHDWLFADPPSCLLRCNSFGTAVLMGFEATVNLWQKILPCFLATRCAFGGRLSHLFVCHFSTQLSIAGRRQYSNEKRAQFRTICSTSSKKICSPLCKGTHHGLQYRHEEVRDSIDIAQTKYQQKFNIQCTVWIAGINRRHEYWLTARNEKAFLKENLLR